MRNWISFFHDWLRQRLGADLDDKLKQYFLSGAYKSIVMQGAIALLTFGTALFIARVTGEEGFGVYTTVFTWIAIASVGATLGLDDLALKQLPIYEEQQQPALIHGLLRWSNCWGLLVGIGVALSLLLLANYTAINGLSNYRVYYQWAVWVIPLFVLMHINQASLRALGFLGRGQVAEKVVQPLSFFIALVIFWLYAGQDLSDKQAVIARVCSFVITALVAFYLLIKVWKPYKQTLPEQETKKWWGSSRYFAFTSLLYIVNTRIDIVLLSFYEVGEAEIAYYNAALKLSDMALIPFAVLYTVTAPMFSKLYAAKRLDDLQEFYTKTTRLSFLVIAFILLVLVLGGHWFLGLFGAGFVQGYPILLLLCGVKLLHVFVGPANYLVMMIDLEREATWILLTSVLVTVLLHHYLIPTYAGMGAASATFIGLLLFEVLLIGLTYSKSGIMPTILGRFSKRKK
ncbi:MAG: oligosaccharide flippase family protein [Aureispira sp.]